MNDKDAKDKIRNDTDELVLANYDGQVKSLAIVWVNDQNDMRILMTVGPNMSLAMVGAVSLLDFELKTMVKKEFSNEQ